MLRFLASPAQLAVHALALLLIGVMLWLGGWQLGRAQGDAVAALGTDNTVASLTELSQPGAAPDAASYGRLVEVRGTYDPSRQLTVPGRPLDGREGSWIVTPLLLADGSLVPVVRGWAPAGTPAQRPDSAAAVEVSGRFLPSQEIARDQPSGSDEIGSVDITALESRWGGQVHEGFVLARTENPPVLPMPERVPDAAGVPDDRGAPFSNLGYAVQWWAFTGFVLFMWWKILSDRWKSRGEREPVLEEVHS